MKSPFIFLFLTIISTFLLNGQIKEVKETASGISKRLQHEIDITKDLEPLFIDYFKSKNANQEPNEELMQLLQEIKNA